MSRTTSTRTLCLAASLLVVGPGCDGDDGGDDASDTNADSANSTADDGGSSQICLDEARDDFAIGLQRDGARFQVAIADALPSDPIRGDNGWTVLVTEDGEPVNATISIGSWMPDHGHGSPVQAEAEWMADGEYMLEPLNLFMAGLWEVTLELETDDGEVDEVMFSVCVE